MARQLCSGAPDIGPQMAGRVLAVPFEKKQAEENGPVILTI
jgi:hypothetical protein